MRQLIYSMGISLDGFIADGSGHFDWAAPGPDLHAFHNEQAREVGTDLYGRGLYETMLAWDEIAKDPDADPVMADFADAWINTPKLVFSRTLERVEMTNARLATGDAVETVAELKRGDGAPLAVGGASLASSLVAAGLVDEFRLFVNPVVVGGGTPFFPSLPRAIRLGLVEQRTFEGGVLYLRYRAQ